MVEVFNKFAIKKLTMTLNLRISTGKRSDLNEIYEIKKLLKQKLRMYFERIRFEIYATAASCRTFLGYDETKLFVCLR